MSARRGIWAALAVTLGAVAWMAAIEGDDDTVVVRTARNAGGSASPKATNGQRSASVQAAASQTAADDLNTWPQPPAQTTRPTWAALDKRAARSWSPPPPAPVPAAARDAVPPSNEPVMPPVPYTLLGRLDDGAQPMALIASAQRTYSAKAGDVLDGTWRVESVGPQGVALVWLPGMRTLQLTYRPSS